MLKNARKIEKGMSLVATLLIVTIVVVVGFVGIKIAGAYMDVKGLQADLEASGRDLPLHCMGGDCEDKLIEQIEQLRDAQQRDLVLDYSTLDYDNGFMYISGMKEVDFKVRTYKWKFTIKAMVE